MKHQRPRPQTICSTNERLFQKPAQTKPFIGFLQCRAKVLGTLFLALHSTRHATILDAKCAEAMAETPQAPVYPV